jgi:hypothetical protein
MMRNGIAYQLPPLAHLTDATESGLLPTPTASDATVGEIFGKNDTFKVTKSGSIRKYTKNGIGGSLGLARYVKFWPTPCARDWKDTAISLEMLAREGKILQPSQVSLLRSLGGNPWWGNEPEISRLKDNGLNPEWVEWLMGFPIGWTEGGSHKERLCSLGNAVVPIIPEMIAYSINEYEKTYVHTHLSRQHDCETV